MARPNFSRICVECASHSGTRGGHHMCDAQRNLVTGKTIEMLCVGARSASGHCGPDGRNFSPAVAVAGSEAGPRKNGTKPQLVQN